MADLRANSRNIEPRFYIGSGLDQRRSDFLSKHEEGGCWGPGIRHCCQFLNRQSDCARRPSGATVLMGLDGATFLSDAVSEPPTGEHWTVLGVQL
jgi:hypothetical protein